MKFQAVHISYPSWENTSPIYTSRGEAEQWLSNQIRGKDWGYVIDLAELDRKTAAEMEILRHAHKHLQGIIAVKDVESDGECYHGHVTLTMPDRIEHYEAWASNGAVGMVNTRVEKLAALPLFAT